MNLHPFHCVDYATVGSRATSWSDAGNVTGDTVLEETDRQLDADGNAVLTTTRERDHDATGTGALGTPTSGVPARVYYAGAYYDNAGRATATVDVGTNGGTPWTVPATVPL